MSSRGPGVIGDGIEIRPSSIPNAGLGLWTTRVYPKSALITEYCGTIVSFQHARRLREAQQDSHIRVLSSFHECIDGIKEQQPGLGGASFANDARNSRKNNAAFTTRYDRKLARNRVFLKAKWDLPVGTEVFVSYGNTYWDLRAIPPAAADSPGQHDMPAQLQDGLGGSMSELQDVLATAMQLQDCAGTMQDGGEAELPPQPHTVLDCQLQESPSAAPVSKQQQQQDTPWPFMNAAPPQLCADIGPVSSRQQGTPPGTPEQQQQQQQQQEGLPEQQHMQEQMQQEEQQQQQEKQQQQQEGRLEQQQVQEQEQHEEQQQHQVKQQEGRPEQQQVQEQEQHVQQQQQQQEGRLEQQQLQGEEQCKEMQQWQERPQPWQQQEWQGQQQVQEKEQCEEQQQQQQQRAMPATAALQQSAVLHQAQQHAMPPVPLHGHCPSTPTRTPSRTPPNTLLAPCQLHGATSCRACCSAGQDIWQLLSPQHSPSAVLRAKLSPFAQLFIAEAGGIDVIHASLWGSSSVQRTLPSPKSPAVSPASLKAAAAPASAPAPAGAASPSGARWTYREARQTTMAAEQSSPVLRSRRRLYSRSALRPDCDLKSPAMQQQQQQEPPSTPTSSAAGKGHTGCAAQQSSSSSSSSLDSQCLDLDGEDTTCSADEHTKQKQKLGATAWSPSRWPKTHVQQMQQQQEQQQQSSRPQRRRRAPDPERQYNGTAQAAKPIEGWW